MAVELHVRSSTLAVLIARALQSSAMTACVTPGHGFYVNHVNPVPQEAQWSVQDAGTATLRLPLDVFLVRRDDLPAAPDRPPAGAQSPAGRLGLILQVSADHGALAVIAQDVNLGPAGAALGDAAAEVRAAILALAGIPPRVDAGGILGSLGIDTSTAAGTVVLAGDLLVARFGSLAGPAAPVSHGFDWALFLDAASIESLVRARVPASMPPLQSVTTRAQWEPTNTAAFLQAYVEGPVKVPDPATLRATLALGCTFSLPRPVPELRVDVSYDLSFDVGALGFDPIVAALVSVAENQVRSSAVNPATFGGVRTGDSSFAITIPLPQIRVANEPWSYDGMAFGPAGLVLGGSVAVPVDLVHVVLETTTHRFSGGNVAFLFCSRDQRPDTRPTANLFSTVAVVEYQGAGTICDVTVLPEGAGYEPHLILPKALPLTNGLRPGAGSILMAFGATDANDVNTSIQLIIRTPRGVRYCDLGQPQHFVFNADGTVAGGQTFYIDDCQHLPPNFGDMTPDEYARWSGLIWYTYWGLVPGKDYDPENPPIIPDTLSDIPAQWGEAAVVPTGTATGIGTQTTVFVPERFGVSEVNTATQGLKG